MKAIIATFIAITCHVISANSQDLLVPAESKNRFTLVGNAATAIYADKQDDWLARKTAELLQEDLYAITGKRPDILDQLPANAKQLIVIGTIEGSPLIKELVRSEKLRTDSVYGKWEAGLIQHIPAPTKTIGEILVITGSDKRGMAYAALEISRQAGISPWYWWGDVPPANKTQLFIKKQRTIFSSPSVKYRGIFINDEAPAFSGWTREKFGGFNHKVYEKVFELILRLKGNYLWPAMWGNAFNDDDMLNPVLAHKWGIVMGTSHHEPMLRAQAEWKRFGKGAWDYTKNESVLRDFWQTGIKNMQDHESLVTIGMRGDGDEPMTAGTATELLERIVKDQREIIANTTGKPAAETPQVWALYKEVQDYFDKGMRVPNDVTLLLCDDNWGNIRRLPKPSEPRRRGGYGIYYHFDYVGGPRNYKWLNTNNLARVWEQMHLAYEHKVDQVWIVNVGDLKPMELPISFFLDYAWNTSAWNESNINEYYTRWAGQQFGKTNAKEIGAVLREYAFLSARRKPELLDSKTYHLYHNDAEGARVLAEWQLLRDKAEKISGRLDKKFADAFFQLVLHPVLAMSNLHELYNAVAWNQQLAAANDPMANTWADKAKEYYLRDSLLTIRYNRELSGGKWNHMMDQTHIGYTYWQEPKTNRLPALIYISESAMKPGKPDLTVIPAPSFTPISISPTSFKKISTGDISWKIIPGIGKEGDGITSFPVTSATGKSNTKAPSLEYQFELVADDSISVYAYFSPTLNIYNDEGLTYSLSIDGGPERYRSINKADNNNRTWEKWVADNIIRDISKHKMNGKKHIIRYRVYSPGMILQKIVISGQELPASYLAP